MNHVVHHPHHIVPPKLSSLRPTRIAAVVFIRSNIHDQRPTFVEMVGAVVNVSLMLVMYATIQVVNHDSLKTLQTIATPLNGHRRVVVGAVIIRADHQ
jgi:hypothetical protein